jgi:hypothetical protein
MSAAALALLLCALACPLGMGLMMLFMQKGHNHSAHKERNRPEETRDERAD